MKRYIDFLLEAADNPRIPHPEDSIFDNSASAARYVEALREIIGNPGSATIKWDGEIALYFGRDQRGEFFISDKYMPAKNFYPKTPADWIKYDQDRGANRSDLYRKINLIWPGLEAAVGTTPGVFKGDLMFVGPLQPVNNEFVFKPVTVEYHVPVNSDLGKLIAGRRALIVVHQYEGAPWDGRGLTPNAQVTVIPPNMGLKFALKNPVQLVQAATVAVSKLGPLADQFLAGTPNVVRDALKKYLGQFKTQRTNLPLADWLRSNVSAKQYKFLVGEGDGYLATNRRGLDAVFKIWNAISALKENLAQQLESQVQGMQQYVAGQPQGEGFVIPSRAGLVKLVQRGGFGAAHFGGFAAKK